MSWLHHAIKRLKHYADPRTAFKAQVHAAQRVAHYADPRTHIHAAERAAHFTERQAKKDYIKFNRVTSFIAPVVTPILAFVGELIPVFGLVIGPALAFMGAVIARVSTSVSLRSKGITGHHNSQMSRGKQNRTLKYGLAGSAAGGLASLAGLSLAAAPTAAPTVAEASQFGATMGTAQSGELGAVAGANTGAFAGQAAAGGFVLPTAPFDIGNKTVQNVSSSPAQAPVAPAPAGGSGILGTGVTWSQVGSVVSPLVSLAPSVLKYFGIGQPAAPAPAGGSQLSGGGSGGGGGAEGTGDVSSSPLGALSESLAGLPLPVKLGAAAVGLGVVALAFTKGRKAA